MIKKILFVFVLGLSSINIMAQEQAVLFIGNSMTSYNDMPMMLQNMVNERKLPIKIKMAVSNGWSLVPHTFYQKNKNNLLPTASGKPSANMVTIINSKANIVVLQEAPVQLLIPEKLKYCTIPAVKYLDSIARSINAKTLLFQNFTQNTYPIQYCIPNGPNNAIFKRTAFDPEQHFDLNAPLCCSDSFQSRMQEFEALKNESIKLAKDANISLVVVGTYFERCRSTYPEIQLYVEDDDHPSPEGSYLIACVFFRYITKEKLSGLHYNADINVRTAEKIRTLVDQGLL